jgi:hypothetical protein
MSPQALIWTVAAVATAGVIVRPFNWPEAVWAATGAALLVLSGLLSPADALAGVAPPKCASPRPAARALPRRAGLIWRTAQHMVSRLPPCGGRDIAPKSVCGLSGARSCSSSMQRSGYFSKAHDVRNPADYEGQTEVDGQLPKELIHCAMQPQKAVLALDPPPD